jgi:Tfp pilus assembly protein PilE
MSYKKSFAFARQRGFSSVELGLTLLVVAILVVGAITLFTKNLRQTSIGDNVSQLQQIAATAKATYGAQNQYAKVDLAVAVQGHIIPESLRDGTAKTATNKFGAPITVTAVKSGSSAVEDMLKVFWGNVPASQCLDIITGVHTQMRQIQIGTTDVKALDTDLDVAGLPGACEVNGTDGNVDVYFFIGRS